MKLNKKERTKAMILLLERMLTTLKDEYARDDVNYYGVSKCLKQCSKSLRYIGRMKA